MNGRLLYFYPLLTLFMLLYACAAYRGPTMDDGGITFKMKSPGAESVSIAGSFNRWDPDANRLAGPDREGWWSITLSLGPGRHEYLFLLDGKQWRADPNVQFRAEDGFGGENSVLYVSLYAGRPARNALQKGERATSEKFHSTVTSDVLRSKSREAGEIGIPAGDIAALTSRGAARGVDAQTLGQFLDLGISTERQNLPARPILDTIQQGLTKERTTGEIARAAQVMKTSLLRAGTLIDEALKKAGKEEAAHELRASAEAVGRVLRAGVASSDVSELSLMAFDNNVQLSQFTRSMESIAKLHEAGMPENLMALTARHFIVQNYSEREIARKEIEFFFLINKGVSWENAFACIHQGFLGYQCGWSVLD